MTKPRMFTFLRDFIEANFSGGTFSAEDVFENMPDDDRVLDFHDDMEYVRQHLDTLCESDSPFLSKEGDVYRLVSSTSVSDSQT